MIKYGVLEIHQFVHELFFSIVGKIHWNGLL
jgi:hypothetical protein